MKKLAYLLFLLSCSSHAANLLVTGELSSKSQHLISTPKSTGWQIQIQWLEKEGTQVDFGDVVAIFDGSNTQAQLTQHKEQLVSLQLELQKTEMDLTQKILEAKGAYEVANLNVDKALIEAEITSDDVSDYEKGQYKLTLERTVFTKVKAEQQLKQAKENKINQIRKKKIEIQKLEQDISYKTSLLSNLEVKSKVKGVVFHLDHPWNGEKMSAGMMVQAAMQVMIVQGEDAIQINAWLHEIDGEQAAVGQSVNVSLDAYPEQKFKGKITKIFTQSEQKQQWSKGAYYRMEVAFDEQPLMPLSAGMSARLQLEGSSE